MTKTRPPHLKKKKEPLETDLSKVYYDPKESAGYSGAKRLASKFPEFNVKKWLSKQGAYSLHKPLVRKFPTRKYRTSGPNDLWQMDLVEMIPYASINDGYKYILTCIDVFSRFARVQPLQGKDGGLVAAAISDMLDKVPCYVQTDLGKEFYNTNVKLVFDEHKIKHYTVFSEYKAALVERFNRTLRGKLNRYFTHKGNKRWINVLQDLVDAYNNSPHRGIQNKRPIDVSRDLNFWLKEELKNNVKPVRKPYAEGSIVRISRISANPFRKNFDQNWSEEVFRIAAIDRRDQPLMYILKDLNDEVVQGKFYHQELQVIDKVPDVYRIEKVIRSRGKGKHKQLLVKWHGYDDYSWISEDKLVDQYEE